MANPTRASFSGWVRMPASCLRDDPRSILDPSTGERQALIFENGVRAWTAPRDRSELTRENTAETFPDNAPGTGGFSSVKVNAFAPRWLLKEICAAGGSARGNELRRGRTWRDGVPVRSPLAGEPG